MTLLPHMPATPKNSFKVKETTYYTYNTIQKLKCLYPPQN